MPYVSPAVLATVDTAEILAEVFGDESSSKN
jgi:hypothetical protein